MYSSFDQKIFSVIIGAAVSNIKQNAPNPAANINIVSSLAPFTDFLCHERKAMKKETSAVAMKNIE